MRPVSARPRPTPGLTMPRCDLPAAFVMCAWLVACVVREPSASPHGLTVAGPPPAAVAETPTVPPPNATSVWIAGYWHWTGARYAWIPGHWESPPPGAKWQAPRYTTHEGSYIYESGGWKTSSRP